MWYRIPETQQQGNRATKISAELELPAGSLAGYRRAGEIRGDVGICRNTITKPNNQIKK